MDSLDEIERRWKSSPWGFAGDIAYLVGQVKRLRRELLEASIAGDHPSCARRELELLDKLKQPRYCNAWPVCTECAGHNQALGRTPSGLTRKPE